MPMLIPCPGCQRHVRAGDSACPFCGVSVRSSTAASRAVPRASAGLKRAALFALSATVAASACGSESEDSGKSPAAASQGTGSMGTTPSSTVTDDGADLPSDEGDTPADTATTGILPGEPNPTQPKPEPSDTGDDVDDPPVIEPEPTMDPAPTMKPEPTAPKPTGPNTPPQVQPLYGAVPAPIDDEPPADEADAGAGQFDPEGQGGAPTVDEPDEEGGAGGSGGRNEPPPQVQPLYGAVPAPQE